MLFFFFEIKVEEGDNYFSNSYIKMWKQALTLSQMGILTWPDILQILLSTLGTHNESDTILTHKEIIKELSAYTREKILIRPD